MNRVSAAVECIFNVQQNWPPICDAAFRAELFFSVRVCWSLKMFIQNAQFTAYIHSFHCSKSQTQLQRTPYRWWSWSHWSLFKDLLEWHSFASAAGRPCAPRPHRPRSEPGPGRRRGGKGGRRWRGPPSQQEARKNVEHGHFLGRGGGGRPVLIGAAWHNLLIFWFYYWVFSAHVLLILV